jgi:hypothetical protein
MLNVDSIAHFGIELSVAFPEIEGYRPVIARISPSPMANKILRKELNMQPTF